MKEYTQTNILLEQHLLSEGLICAEQQATAKEKYSSFGIIHALRLSFGDTFADKITKALLVTFNLEFSRLSEDSLINSALLNHSELLSSKTASIKVLNAEQQIIKIASYNPFNLEESNSETKILVREDDFNSYVKYLDFKSPSSAA